VPGPDRRHEALDLLRPGDIETVPCASCPSARIWATALATPGSSIAASSTTDPCRARHCAAAKPIPVLPPITIETAPSSRRPPGGTGMPTRFPFTGTKISLNDIERR
jgi:hypothetical protein